MPLHWTIDSRLKLFLAVADGEVELGEVEQMLDAMVGSNTLGFRKLFDGSLGDTRMNAMEILSLGVRMRSLASGTALGPLAVVVPDDKYWLVARVLGVLSAANRPMRIFKNRERALAWLDSPSLIASSP